MNTHHAIVCVADTLESSSVPALYKKQSSDVSHIVLDRFSIADARQLGHDALQKPLELDHRVFVLVVKKLPEESQNALLKLFEEPPLQTRFFLVIPQEGILIPTLRSRVSLEGSVSTGILTNTVFATFKDASYAERLVRIADAAKKKDIQYYEDIVRGAEVYVATDVQKNPKLLKTVLCIRGYMKTPGASAKMLLEELALTL
jgi:hypothetical protein